VEVVLERHNCTFLDDKGKHTGLFVLSSRFLSFDLLPLGSGKGNFVSISLADITSIVKSKVKLFWDAIEVEAKNKHYTLYDFDNRDQIFKHICDQTVSVGNTHFSTSKKE